MALIGLVPQARAMHNATELTSTGTIGGNGAFDSQFRFASSGGTRAFFATSESLVAADTDSAQDIYARSAGATTLVSAGPAGGNGPHDAQAAGISDDGTVVFFTTAEQMTADDTDSTTDVYRRAGGVTTLISTADGTGNGAFGAQFLLTTPDGAHVVFSTDEPLVPEDTDSSTDSYVRSGATTTLATTATGAGNGPFGATARSISDDGDRVVFETHEQLTGGDTDSYRDLYVRAGATTEHLSTGPTGGNGDFDADFNAASPNGLIVYFTTSEPLTAGDAPYDCGYYQYGTYPCPDIYQRAGATTTLVSGPQDGILGWPAEFGQVTASGTRVYFKTGEGGDDICGEDISEGDEFGCADIWKWEAGSKQLVSPGQCGGGFENFSYCDVHFNRATDGGSVFFTTLMALSPQDAENQDCVDPDLEYRCSDVYEYVPATGGVRLVSTGPTAGPTPVASAFAGASDDGAHAFFTTTRKMVAADTDSSVDVYERHAGATTLISTGPNGGNGAFDVTFNDVSADGLRAFFTTSESLTAPDADTRPDVYESRFESAAYARPKGATPVYFSLVPAYNPCTAPNRTHGPALVFGSCNPPVPGSSHLTVGVGDGSPALARSVGSVRMNVLPGPAGPPDDTDVGIRFSLTNVMRASTLSEYTGELRARVVTRLTDKEGSTASTTADFPLSWVVPCAATPDPQVAAACALDTTLDALVPGAAAEGTRAIWAFDKLRVDDGGPDEDADTGGDNALFATQGIFVP